ncbi:MAG: hypothetical protein SGPRY_014002, partial [Prymnesium sp.]
MTFWLSLLCIYDGGLLSAAAHAAHTGESETHFYPRPELLRRLAVGAGLFSTLGFCLLVVSGTPIARAMPPQIGDVLGLLCLANAASHVAVCYVIYTNRPWGVLQPTDFSERRRDLALGVQCVLAFLFFLLGFFAFASAHNPLPCDSNADEQLSLSEAQHCLDLSAIAELFSHIHFASPRVVGLGLLLATIWLCDAAVCSMAAKVQRTGQPMGVLQPIDAEEARGEHGRSERTLSWLRRLSTATVTLRLLGCFTLGLTLSPKLFATFFGSNGIVAINLLSLTLLLHSPVFALLSSVFFNSKPALLFRPTELSRRSSLPEWLAAAASVGCFVTGVTLILVYDALPPLPAWHGIDAHALLLCLLFALDGGVCVQAALCQYERRAYLLFRPFPDATPDELLAFGSKLAGVGGVAHWLSFLALLLSLNRSAANEAFSHDRALELVLELCLASHGVILSLLSYAMQSNVSIGVCEAPSDPSSAAWLGKMLRIAGVAAAVIGIGLPLLDGFFWWEAAGMALYTVLLAGVILTHGMYAGDVVADALERHGISPSKVRHLSFGITALAAAVMGVCFALATCPAGSITLRYAYFYYLLTAMCAFCFLNLLPLAAAMETWYTDTSVCGFSAEDAPTGKAKVPLLMGVVVVLRLPRSRGGVRGDYCGGFFSQRLFTGPSLLPSACALLSAAIACCAVGGALWAFAVFVVRLDDSTAILHGELPEVGVEHAE